MMMQAILNKAIKCFFLACVLIVTDAGAQVKHASKPGVHFLEKDWQSVLTLAKKMHKPIFVDAYTTWCAPCQEMKQKTFTDPNIAAVFNARFINVAIDVEHDAGISFADHYLVTVYPTLFFIDADGRVIKRMEGFADAKQLAAAAANMK